MMFKRQIAAALIVLAAAVCAPLGFATPAVAKDDAQLTVGVGPFGFGVASKPDEVEGRAEYRFAWGFLGTKDWFRGFKPLLGVTANTGGSAFVYAGLAAPMVWDGGRWEIVPEGGIGYYRQGKGLFLGGERLFHVGLNASYAVTDSGRLGVGIYHISNANTYRKNPGVNSILVTWAFTFGDR